MKRLYFTVVLLAGLATANSFAQEQPIRVFTLDECIQYALGNSSVSKNSILDQEIAESVVKETIGMGLPQINASAR